MLAQLALDIVGLTAFLYFNGGYANPFASLFLLPLAVAATVYLANRWTPVPWCGHSRR